MTRKFNVARALSSMLALPLLFQACVELTPTGLVLVDPPPALQDTTYVDNNLPQTPDKVVVFEEFTGVKCTACPQGHAVSAQLLTTHGNQMAAIAIHNSHSLAKPHKDRPDYRTDDGRAVSTALGGDGSIPGASVDRTIFSGNSSEVEISHSKWGGNVDAQLLVVPEVDVDLSLSYDSQSRELKILVKSHFLEAQSGPHNLSISITESNIIDLQSFPLGVIDSQYVHDHVLRDMVGPSNGNALATDPVKGTVVIKEYGVTIPPEWNPDELEVVAFVHRIGTDNVILQGAKRHL